MYKYEMKTIEDIEFYNARIANKTQIHEAKWECIQM